MRSILLFLDFERNPGEETAMPEFDSLSETANYFFLFVFLVVILVVFLVDCGRSSDLV